MIRLANVIVANDNHFATDMMVARLKNNGYHATVATSSTQVHELARSEHPDLVLIGNVGVDAVELGAALKGEAATADIPVLLLAEAVSPQLCGRALAAGLDDVIAWDCEDTELFARLRPLVRLATMHAELRHRAAIAAKFDIPARDRAAGPDNVRPAILVVGEDPDGVQAILAAGAEITASANLYEAEELLIRRNFDAAVLSTASDIEGYLAFCSQVRNNPRLFNLPMLLVSDGSVSLAEAYRRGATRVLARPADPVVLRSAVLTLVRRQQLRWSIRAVLFDSLKEVSRDPLTGVYGRAFFDAYLDNRLTIAKSQDRHLAVVFFYIPNIEGVRSHFGEDAAEHLSEQLGQWITGLLRAEDLTAFYGKNEFCVVLPDTPLSEAEVVMHRIAGVLSYTDFAVRDVYQPIKVWVQVACTDAQPGDDRAGLLARAHHNLD
jgi:two-component system, cell cycle response regulator